MKSLDNISKIILIAVAIVGLTWWVQDLRSESKLDKFVQESKQWGQDRTRLLDSLKKFEAGEAQHDSTIKADSIKSANTDRIVDKQKREVAAARVTVSRLESALKDSTTTLRDSVGLFVKITAGKDSILAVQDSTIKQREQQVTLERKLSGEKDVLIASLRWERDTLKTFIRTAPVLNSNPEKLFGVISLPSRKVSLAAGFILGVATMVVLTK